jgi:putative transcriptional regulator
MHTLHCIWEVKQVATEQLGNRLRVARAERRLSQAELADLVRVTRQTISAIETGLYCPSALLAFLLARELGKRVDEVFFIEGEVK